MHLENHIEGESIISDSKPKQPSEIKLPQEIIESFARFLVPELRKFYASEEGQQAFRKWVEKQETKDSEE